MFVISATCIVWMHRVVAGMTQYPTGFESKYAARERVLPGDVLSPLMRWSEDYSVGNDAMDRQHQRLIGLINDLAPVLKVDGEFIPNPMVHTEFVTDAYGRSLYGQPLEGVALAEAKAVMKSAEVDFSLLDAEVEKLCGKLALTMPAQTAPNTPSGARR